MKIKESKKHKIINIITQIIAKVIEEEEKLCKM